MRRVAIAGVLAAALVAVTAAAGTAGAVSTRSTAEFGRCVKYAKGEAGSGYSDPACTKAVESTAKYHWVPGPGAHPGFSASASGVALTLHVPKGKAKPTVECASGTSTGEFTGVTSESLGLTLSGCKMGASSCQSSGAAPGEVQFTPMLGTLAISKHEHWGEALVLWSPAIGETLASFECGTTSVVIGPSMLHPIVRDKMVSSEAERLVVWKDGTQRPNCYEPCMTSETPQTSIGGAPGVYSGIAMTGTQTNEEAIEADTLR